MNKILNAILALMQDKPHVAWELLRSPELRVVNTSEIHNKINIVLSEIKVKAMKSALTSVLNSSLALDPPSEKEYSKEYIEAWMAGVTEVEAIVQEWLNQYDGLDEEGNRD